MFERRTLTGDGDGLFEIGRGDQEISADGFLGFGKGAVYHEASICPVHNLAEFPLEKAPCTIAFHGTIASIRALTT
jgi:hypothetical protein